MSWTFQIFHDSLASQKFSVESSRDLSFTIITFTKEINNITYLLAYVSLIWSQGYYPHSQGCVMSYFIAVCVPWCVVYHLWCLSWSDNFVALCINGLWGNRTTGHERNPVCLLGTATPLNLGSHLVRTINNSTYIIPHLPLLWLITVAFGNFEKFE